MIINYFLEQGTRPRFIGEAVNEGARKNNYRCCTTHKSRFRNTDTDVAAMYGLRENSREIMIEYLAKGKKTLFFDLGYWGRHTPDRRSGHHRIAINGFHAKFGREECSSDRFKRFDIELKSFNQSGDYILLCGQSAKAAWVYGLDPEEWELQIIEQIKENTDKPIWYVPKPSWDGKRPIPGTVYCDGPVEQYIDNCWAVVTHHSNSGVHALAAGKPVFTQEGVCKSLIGELDLTSIDDPFIPSELERDNFLFNVAYWQWSIDEIKNGSMFRSLRERGLL